MKSALAVIETEDSGRYVHENRADYRARIEALMAAQTP